MLRLILLSPLLAVQALWVILRARRLPEAAGPREGTLGTGQPLRVLVLGDSSAAGVGVADQRDALAGQLAQALQANHQVHWQVIAKSGATAASTCALLRTTPPHPFDVAVIAVGVNDCKNGHSLRRWQREYRHLRDLIRQQGPDSHLYLSALPPFEGFPLLPAPLRHVLGTRARRFDRVLQQIAAEDAACTHLGFDIPLDPAKMAADGFHPGPEVYTYWAGLIAARIRNRARS